MRIIIAEVKKNFCVFQTTEVANGDKEVRIFLSSSNELSDKCKDLKNKIANGAKPKDYFNSSTSGEFVHKYVSFWFAKQTCISNQLISYGHLYHSEKMQIE